MHIFCSILSIRISNSLRSYNNVSRTLEHTFSLYYHTFSMYHRWTTVDAYQVMASVRHYVRITPIPTVSVHRLRSNLPHSFESDAMWLNLSRVCESSFISSCPSNEILYTVVVTSRFGQEL